MRSSYNNNINDNTGTRGVVSWYSRQVRDGVLAPMLVPTIMRLAPKHRRGDIFRALLGNEVREDGGFIEEALLDMLPQSERREVLLMSTLRSPTLAKLRALDGVTSDQALHILMNGSALDFPSDVLRMLAASACKGGPGGCATAIDRCLELSGVPAELLPGMAQDLHAGHNYVDSAALVSALRGMGGVEAVEQDTDLQGIYIKGCVVLGQYETAFRYCGTNVALQRQCLSSLLDNGSTREACEYLQRVAHPEMVLQSQSASRLMEQLGQRSLEAVDPTYFALQIEDLTTLLMEAQQQREVDVRVASALGSCGRWEICLNYFSKCVTLSEMEALLTSAARGGAPFSEIRPYVIAVSKSNPSLTRNGLREILIKCAAEAGAVDEALALFEIAKAKGSSDVLLDHPSLIGARGCEHVPFSTASYLRVGMWREAKKRITNNAEREAWENYVVEHAIESELSFLSVGAAIRLLIRLCKEAHWQKVLEVYFPSALLANTTRQWVSHFIAASLCDKAGADVAFRFLRSYSSLADGEAMLLLHVVAPSPRTVSLLTASSWRSGVMCLTYPAPFVVPSAIDAIRVVQGWSAEECPSSRIFVRLSIESKHLRRKETHRLRRIYYLEVRQPSETLTNNDSEEEAPAGDSPLVSLMAESCRHYGAIPEGEVITRWTRLLTQHHVTGEVVGAWIGACVRSKNIKSALEIIRLSTVVRITPPLGPLLELINICDFFSDEGAFAIQYFRQMPSSDVLLRAVCDVIITHQISRGLDVLPVLQALLGNTGEGVTLPAGVSFLGEDFVPAMPIDGFITIIEAEQKSSCVQCDIYGVGGAGEMVRVSGGRSKRAFYDGEMAARRAVRDIFQNGSTRLWRVVYHACKAFPELLSGDVGSKAMLVLSLSSISPGEMLSLLNGVGFTNRPLVAVFLACYFSHHTMPAEARRHLQGLTDERDGWETGIQSLVDVADVMAMLPTPSLRALAWVKMDGIAMRSVFGPPFVFTDALNSLYQASPHRDSVAFRWLSRPAQGLIDVGDASGHGVDARLAVERFEVSCRDPKRRICLRDGRL